jgi:hypothetical protein
MAMISNPLPHVDAVRHVRGHVLWLRFSDGVEGEVDFTDRLHGAYLGPLRDVDLFAQARAEDGIVVWPNGADSSPEVLYERVLAANGVDPRTIDDAWAAQLATIARMLEISRFFGIVITMLADDHSPPHFHAKYGEFAISVTIRDGVAVGRFPVRAQRLVQEWWEIHQAELLDNWDRLAAREPVKRIPPLD